MGPVMTTRTATLTGAAVVAYMIAPTWQVQFLGPPEAEAVFVSYHSWFSGMGSYTLGLIWLAAGLTVLGTLVTAVHWRSGKPSLGGAILFALAAAATISASLLFGQVTAIPLVLLLAAWIASPWVRPPTPAVDPSS